MLQYVTNKDLLDILMHEHYMTLSAFVDHVHGHHCEKVFRFLQADAALALEIAKRYQYPTFTSFLESALVEACRKGYLDVVRTIRSCFPDTRIKENVVFGAIEQNRLPVLDYLLHETDVTVPLNAADIDVLKMLLATRTFSRDDAATELQRAASRGLCDNYELLMRTFPALRAETMHLNAATLHGNVEMVKLLICKYKRCCPRNIVHSACIVTATLHVRHCGEKWSVAQRVTLVKDAVEKGHVDMVNLFLDTFPATPRLLKRAIKYGQDAVAQYLMQRHGFQPDAAMLVLAAGKCSKETMEALMPYVVLSDEQWIAAFKASSASVMPLFLDERIPYHVVNDVAVVATIKDNVDAARVILEKRPIMAASLFSTSLGHDAYACVKHLMTHESLDLSSQNNAFIKLAVKHHDRDLLLKALQDERVRTTLDYAAIINAAAGATFNDGMIAFYSVTWIRNKVPIDVFYTYFTKQKIWTQASDILLNYLDVFDRVLHNEPLNTVIVAMKSANEELMLRALQRVKPWSSQEKVSTSLKNWNVVIFTLFDNVDIHKAYIALAEGDAVRSIYMAIIDGDMDALTESIQNAVKNKKVPKSQTVTLAMKYNRLPWLRHTMQYEHIQRYLQSERWAIAVGGMWYRNKLRPELLYQIQDDFPNVLIHMTREALRNNDKAYLERMPRIPWETAQRCYDHAIALNQDKDVTLWKQYMLDAQPILKKIKH